MRVRRHPALWGGVAVLCIGVVWLAWSLLPGMAAGWVFATLETEWGVVGRAGQVDLDLVSLEVRVRDLTLAAAGTETQPFLTAEAVTLTLPWSAVFGAPAVDRLDIVAPVVSVRQGDDGTSNLPVLPPREASSDSPGEPLRLGVITVHRASVSWLDEARGLGVVADPVELQLQPVDGDQSQTTGLLTLSTPTRITWGARETAIGPVSARLTAGPSGITVRDVVVTAPEARLALDGEVAFGVPGTQLRFEYGLDLDLGQVVPWLEGAPPIRGAVRIAGRLAGTPAAPVVEARLEAEQIAWADLAARGVTATARVADGRVTVDEFGASLAGGTVEGAGAVTLTGDGTRGEISLSWAGLSADLLSAATWPTRPVAIASSLTGVAAASWTGSDPRDVVVTLNSGHRALPGAGTSGLPIEGQWRFVSGDGRWRVEVESLSAGAVALKGQVGGTVPAALSETGSVPIEGAVDGDVSDLRQFAVDLETLGLTGALGAADVSGTASLALDLSGSVGAPVVTGELAASGGALGHDDGLALRADLSTAAGRWVLDPFDLRLAGSDAQGTAVLHRDTGAVEGNVRLRIAAAAALDTVLPDGWRPRGTIEIAGPLGGHWPEPVLDAAIDATDLAFAGQRFASMQGRVRVSPAELVVEQFSLRQDQGGLDVTGRFVPPTGDYTLLVTGRGLRVAPWRVGDADPLTVEAIVDLDLTGSGSMDAPRVTGQVVTRDLSFRDYTVDRVEHELTVDGDGWRVRSVVPALNATAELTLEPEPSWPYALDVQLDNTSLASLGALAPTGAPGRVEGALTVRLQADGSVTAPADSTVVVVLEQMAGDVNGTSVLLVAPAEVRYARDRIDVDSLDLRVGETRLTASGSLEPTAGSGLRVGLRGDLRHLEWLLPRGDRLEGAGSVAMSGPFQIDASVTGPVEQPELTASLVLDDGVVSLEGAPPLSDLRVRAGYDATGVRLDELRGSWAGAALAASGAIPPPLLAPYLPGRLRFAEGTDSTARFRATVGG